MRPFSIEPGRICTWCPSPIPLDARSDSKFCGVKCRKRSWRFTSACLALGEAPAPPPNDHLAPWRFAYADPPYPGKADYYTDQPSYGGEVDHLELIDKLQANFPDGWALSTSSDALQHVLALCPPTVRVASWHRRIRHVRSKWPMLSWEPLIVMGGRPYQTQTVHPVLDRLTYEGRYASYPGALIGMKPPEFSVWLFRQLNACRGDDVVDLFPGSGAVGRAWQIYGCGERTTVPRAPALSVG